MIFFYWTGVTTILSVVVTAAADSVTSPMVSLRSSANKLFTNQWTRATSLALLEQQVEDYNAEYIARVTSSSSFYGNVAGEIVKHRRLICLPLDDRFDPQIGRAHV